MEKPIKPGIYKHFKGKIYKVLAVGKSSENLEPQVIYQALYEDCGIWTRPAKEWNQFVTIEGKKVKRFEPFDITQFPTTTQVADKNAQMCYFDKIALIDIKNHKVLMARSKGKEHFYMPGGKREAGENDIQCLAREIKEELGVEIDANTVSYYGTYTAYSHKDTPPAQLIMYQAKYKRKPAATSEVEEIAWLGYKDREKAIGSGRTLMDELYWKGLIK